MNKLEVQTASYTKRRLVRLLAFLYLAISDHQTPDGTSLVVENSN